MNLLNDRHFKQLVLKVEHLPVTMRIRREQILPEHLMVLPFSLSSVHTPDVVIGTRIIGRRAACQTYAENGVDRKSIKNMLRFKAQAIISSLVGSRTHLQDGIAIFSITAVHVFTAVVQAAASFYLSSPTRRREDWAEKGNAQESTAHANKILFITAV